MHTSAPTIDLAPEAALRVSRDRWAEAQHQGSEEHALRCRKMAEANRVNKSALQRVRGKARLKPHRFPARRNRDFRSQRWRQGDCRFSRIIRVPSFQLSQGNHLTCARNP